MSQETITIIDCSTNQPVEAVLETDLDRVRLIDAEIEWAPERLRALRHLMTHGTPGQPIPQHVHWNWAVKALQTQLLAYRSLGIEREGKFQGLMMVCLTGHLARLDPDKGKPLVYVEFVETAPWNAKEFTATPMYKGVGVRLMQAAVHLSVEEGFAGRVGLHSLPQAKPFYAGTCTMHALGPDANYHNLEYFEITAVEAAELLKK
jgi:hypothetical protein